MTWRIENSPEYVYLNQVLGLNFLPRSEAATRLLVLVPDITNTEIKSMVARMMSALGVGRYELTDSLKAGPGVGLMLVDPTTVGLGGLEPGGTVEQEGRTWLVTLPVHRLIHGAADGIAQAKRETWTHLQLLKTLLEEPG